MVKAKGKDTVPVTLHIDRELRKAARIQALEMDLSFGAYLAGLIQEDIQFRQDIQSADRTKTG